MHILFINTYRKQEWGGGETWMHDVAEGMRARGHACTIAGKKGSVWFNRFEAEGWKPVACAISHELSPFVFLRVRRILREIRPDLVLCNFNRETRAMAFARGRKRTPVIINLRGLPVIKKSLNHRLTYKYLVDHTVVCASFIKEKFKKLGCFDLEKISVIHNAFNPPAKSENPTLRKELGLTAGVPIVGCVARFEPRKGVIDLVQAFAKVRQSIATCVLVIVGDGTEKAAIQARIAALNLENSVFLLGYRKDLENIIPHFAIFVLPSHSEGFPYVLQIAEYHGAAIVATSVDGVPEIIADNSNGLLVEPRNPEMLANALVKLIGDKELQKRFVLKGREVLAEKFSYDGMMDKFEELFTSCVFNKTNFISSHAHCKV